MVPFARALAARARVEPPLRALPFREAVARGAAAFGDRFAPLREPVAARAVFAFVDREVGVRFFAAPVPGAVFDADARERVAVLLRVPPLDRFVVAIGSSKRVTPGASVLPARLWF